MGKGSLERAGFFTPEECGARVERPPTGAARYVNDNQFGSDVLKGKRGGRGHGKKGFPIGEAKKASRHRCKTLEGQLVELSRLGRFPFSLVLMEGRDSVSWYRLLPEGPWAKRWRFAPSVIFYGRKGEDNRGISRWMPVPAGKGASYREKIESARDMVVFSYYYRDEPRFTPLSYGGATVSDLDALGFLRDNYEEQAAGGDDRSVGVKEQKIQATWAWKGGAAPGILGASGPSAPNAAEALAMLADMVGTGRRLIFSRDGAEDLAQTYSSWLRKKEKG